MSFESDYDVENIFCKYVLCKCVCNIFCVMWLHDVV